MKICRIGKYLQQKENQFQLVQNIAGIFTCKARGELKEY